MTAPAAFTATFSDWRLIKGRKVVQVVFEIPLELADQAYQALGGMPDPGKSVWCAVARLKAGNGQGRGKNLTEGQIAEAHSDNNSPSASAPRRSFSSLPLPQQAGMLCSDPIFWAFLHEELDCHVVTSPDDAAFVLRARYGIKSRADLGKGIGDDQQFIADREQFMAWKLVSA